MTIPSRAAITAVHGYLPPDLLTNAELARLVDTSDAWIIERTGINERHIQKGEGLGTSHMAAEAVRGLLEKTGTKPEEAFYIRIDEVLNTDYERSLGRLHIEIGVRPSYPAEFIVVRIGIWQGGSDVSET